MEHREALVLVPGLLCDEALWAAQVQGLNDLVVPQVITARDQETMAAMADYVLQRSPPVFALGGLSMGGYVAQEIVRRAPERVTRLALLDTSPYADTPGKTAQRLRFIELASAGL